MEKRQVTLKKDIPESLQEKGLLFFFFFEECISLAIPICIFEKKLKKQLIQI